VSRVAAITERDVACAILTHLDLLTDAPVLAPRARHRRPRCSTTSPARELTGVVAVPVRVASPSTARSTAGAFVRPPLVMS